MDTKSLSNAAGIMQGFSTPHRTLYLLLMSTTRQLSWMRRGTLLLLASFPQ